MNQLEHADLTINFFAYKFFNKKPKVEKYVSQFEGGDTWGSPVYMTSRDEAEAMFDYSGANPRPGADNAITTAQSRVTQLGARAVGRPVGLVVHDPQGIHQTQRHIHTHRFVRCVSQCEAARRPARPVGELPAYAAAHREHGGPDAESPLQRFPRGKPGRGHTASGAGRHDAEIQFERDIQTMVICQDEADESDAKTTKLHSDAPDRYKVVSTKKLKERMQKFADKYGIELRYI